MRYILGFFSILLILFGCNDKPKQNDIEFDEGIMRIAIGSCFDMTRGGSIIFDAVNENRPDLWVWLGDIIYGDSHDMSRLKSLYDAIKKTREYQDLQKSSKIIGVWDDHDYGSNDGGKYYSKRDDSKLLLFEFLETPHDDPVYSRQGAYSAHLFGEDEKTVKIILLDTRYFRDTLEHATDGHNRYKVNSTGDILGETQWKWLEDELLKNEAAIHIIGSGYQVIPWEQGFEKWSNFPKSRNRLFELIGRVNANKTFLISGDRHMAEFSNTSIQGLPYPLYEFTSSGLTHTWDYDRPEMNKHRIGKKVVRKNFGIIKIDWRTDVPKIEFEIRGLNNRLFETFEPEFN